MPHVYNEEDLQPLNEQILALEQLSDRLFDLDNIKRELTEFSGVNRHLAESLESMVPGVISKKLPLATFTKQHSMTNYGIALESVDIISTGVKVGLIAVLAVLLGKVLHAISKFFSERAKTTVGKQAEVAGDNLKNAQSASHDIRSALGKLSNEKRRTVLENMEKRAREGHPDLPINYDSTGGWIEKYYNAVMAHYVGAEFSKITLDLAKHGAGSPYDKFVQSSMASIKQVVEYLNKAVDVLHDAAHDPEKYSHSKGQYSIPTQSMANSLKDIGYTLKLDDFRAGIEEVVTEIARDSHKDIKDISAATHIHDTVYKADMKVSEFARFADDLTRLNDRVTKLQTGGNAPDKVKELKTEIMQSLMIIIDYNRVCTLVYNAYSGFYTNLQDSSSKAINALKGLRHVIEMDVALDGEEKTMLKKAFKKLD